MTISSKIIALSGYFMDCFIIAKSAWVSIDGCIMQQHLPASKFEKPDR
jgi:hypothetical protein